MTTTEHEINRLKAQAKGHVRIISELQVALADTRRHLRLAESRAKAYEIALESMAHLLGSTRDEGTSFGNGGGGNGCPDKPAGPEGPGGPAGPGGPGGPGMGTGNVGAGG